MHNCKKTRERFTELLLDGTNVRDDTVLDLELKRCAECHDEFDSVKKTLRITSRLIETATPPESYWTAYHARLKQEISRPLEAQRRSVRTSWFKELFKSAVRLPVPVAVSLTLVFTIALLSALRNAGPSDIPLQTPSVIHVPVEVPVIQEKVVTRVVYRDRAAKVVKQITGASPINSSLARSQKPEKVTPPTLVGFKPLDEIKLTVIKGGSPDEK